jgi:hypothetical protein
MKNITIVILAMGISAVSYAQNLFGSFSVGYGVSAPGEVLGTASIVDASGNSTASNYYGTFGGGLNVTLSPGYMFNEHLGFEIGANYLSGSEIEITSFTVPTGALVAKSKSTQLRINPSVVISSGNEGLNFYGKAGLIIPVSGSTVVNVSDNLNPLSVEEYTVESSGDFSIGFSGALGVSYGLNNSISIFGELNGVNLRIRGKSQTVTSYTVNGTDVMPLMDQYSKETVYVNELNSSSNNFEYNANASNSAAKEELVGSSNFNAVAFNLGIKYNF